MFVVYEVKTSKIFKTFPTERGAKIAMARAGLKDTHAVTDYDNYDKNIVQYVERTNLMTGKKYMEKVGTPAYLSPACETYWSM